MFPGGHSYLRVESRTPDLPITNSNAGSGNLRQNPSAHKCPVARAFFVTGSLRNFFTLKLQLVWSESESLAISRRQIAVKSQLVYTRKFLNGYDQPQPEYNRIASSQRTSTRIQV